MQRTDGKDPEEVEWKRKTEVVDETSLSHELRDHVNSVPDCKAPYERHTQKMHYSLTISRNILCT